MLAEKLIRTVHLEPHEPRAVWLSALYFFLLFGSYSVLKPMRDAMGTVYGIPDIHELFTATFIVSLLVAPLYSALIARIKLATFLPWVYGGIALSLLVFYGLFQESNSARLITGAFYVWISTFNLLAISVFWTFMADTFTRSQSRRLFGVIAAGGTLGGIAGPAIAAFAADAVGNDGLLLIAAAGFGATAITVVALRREKERLIFAGVEVQHTQLQYPLPGHSFDGFRLLFRSRYLLLIALYLMCMTWVSTVVYIQLGAQIATAFPNAEARTQAYAILDLAINGLTILLQLFGTSRLTARFGLSAGLLSAPLIMGIAFLTAAVSPTLIVLMSLQLIRPVSEYALARPTREMLYTAIDQTSRYKAKNVIDTVIYRFGDLTAAWASTFILPFGLAALAALGALVSAAWLPIASTLGRRYEIRRARQHAREHVAALVSDAACTQRAD
jgi:ATP:ADP antiporter, AAA family